jgi:hypothetical protein
MVSDSRSRVVGSLRETWSEFERATRALTEAQWSFRPTPEGWTLAELAEHLALIEGSTLRIITGRMVEAEASSELIATTEGKDSLIERRVPDRSRRVEAPESLKPTGRWPRPELAVAAFGESRRAAIRWYETTPLDLRRYVAPHPFLGPIDGWQWGLFLAEHLRRHLFQIAELLGAPGYPTE